VITLAAAKRAKIVLAAPTGRAAKRLTELSEHPAATVHRLLALRPGGDPAGPRCIRARANTSQFTWRSA
jgi:exodeoxyribonuclease V alpha subunit